MLSLSRRFADLRIRYKMLISYSAVFVLSFSIGSGIIYFFVKQVIETNIESELTNTTQTILNMVRTSAGVSIKNHLRRFLTIRTGWESGQGNRLILPSRQYPMPMRDRIGPVAAFKTATVVKRLPKTRSGKILRGTIQRMVIRHCSVATGVKGCSF